MNGLNSLKSIFQKKGEEFVQNLLNSYVVVNEKLDGSYFAAILDSNNEFQYYKKGAPITFADRVLNRFYNSGIHHLETLPESVKLELPNFYLFAFQYFARTGRMVLSHIHEMRSDGSFGKTLQNKDVLDAWAETLHVEKPAIIFEGYLNEEQKKHLLNIIAEPSAIPFERSLFSVFGVNEARNIDAVVFRFYESEARNEEKSVVAKLVSPSIETLVDKNSEGKIKAKTDDFIWLILVDLMNYIEKFSIPDLKDIELHSGNVHVRYVELINALYKKYIEDEGAKWEGLEIKIPEYLQDQKFDLNTEFISDTNIRELVTQSEVNKEIYRVFLNMFRNPNVKIASKIFTDGMKHHLKSQIDKLSSVVINQEISETYFPTFTEFLGESTSYFVEDKG